MTECINARRRNWGLQRFTPGGRDQATTQLSRSAA